MFVCLFLQATGLTLLPGCNLLGGSSPPRPSKNMVATGVDEVSGRMRPGDELSIRIDAGGPTQGTATTPGDVIINEDGEITLPLVGDVQAAGLTPQ